jgi:hypothetical protein
MGDLPARMASQEAAGLIRVDGLIEAAPRIGRANLVLYVAKSIWLGVAHDVAFGPAPIVVLRAASLLTLKSCRLFCL